jgi:hypothetical protein
MTDAEAADIFEQFHKDGLPERIKELNAAKKVLSKRFEKAGPKGPKLYRRTIAASWTFPRRFSQTKAVELGYLDDRKIEACKVEGTTLTLSYVGPTE